MISSVVLKNVRYNDKDNTAEGMDNSLGYTVITGVPLHQVANSGELKELLQKNDKIPEMNFTLCIHTSMWDWELDEASEEVNKDALTCTHEWVNVGFSTIKMVCKHCDRDAPAWVQNRYEYKD